MTSNEVSSYSAKEPGATVYHIITIYLLYYIIYYVLFYVRILLIYYITDANKL